MNLLLNGKLAPHQANQWDRMQVVAIKVKPQKEETFGIWGSCVQEKGSDTNNSLN